MPRYVRFQDATYGSIKSLGSGWGPYVTEAGPSGSSELVFTCLTTYLTLVDPENDIWKSNGWNIYGRHFNGTSWGTFSKLPSASIGSWTSPHYQKGMLFRSLQDNSVNRVFGQYNGTDFDIVNYKWNETGWNTTAWQFCRLIEVCGRRDAGHPGSLGRISHYGPNAKIEDGHAPRTTASPIC